MYKKSVMYSLKQVRKIKVLQNAPGVGREEGWSVGLLVGLSVSPMQSPPSYEHSVTFSLQSQDNRLYVSFQFQKIDFNLFWTYQISQIPSPILFGFTNGLEARQASQSPPSKLHPGDIFNPPSQRPLLTVLGSAWQNSQSLYNTRSQYISSPGLNSQNA